MRQEQPATFVDRLARATFYHDAPCSRRQHALPFVFRAVTEQTPCGIGTNIISLAHHSLRAVAIADRCAPDRNIATLARRTLPGR